MPTSMTTAPGLTAVGAEQARHADRGDEDVGAAADRLQVAGARVADGDRRVGRQQQAGDRARRPASSGRRRPPRRPRGRPPRGASSSITPAGVQGDEAGHSVGEQAGVGRGQPVDVLAGVERGDDRGRGRCAREAAAGRGSRRRRRRRRARRPAPSSSSSEASAAEAVVDGPHPRLLAGLVLVGDVDLRGGVVADDHRRQGRRPPGLGRCTPRLRSRPCARTSAADRLAVDHPGRPTAYRFLIGA